MRVHPTSIIEGDVEIAEGAEVGPYCHIQGKVKIGKGTYIEAHVTVGSRHGIVEIGENNHFAPGSAIGGPPQDIGYKSEPTRLVIGNNNVIREFSTINIATAKATRATVIGHNCYFMAYTHIGHDCEIRNNVTIANNTNLGGHTVVEDNVTISGVCAFNQFSRIGKGSFVAGCSVVNKDILPFSKAQGNYAVCRATNKIGLSRRGFSPQEIENVHRAIRIVLMGTDTVAEALARIEAECEMSENIQYFTDFIRSSKRGIAK
ncbi:MAG: acyl-ACP--UDP-N-acetylglucosamine O-acyltransferase [Bdellovibrio sp.]|jgi:UDP-N-acetylglucosamine acyltransferase